MDTLRVGLIGYGASGRGQHARMLRALGQRVTCVVTGEHGAAVREDWPRARVVPDVASMLASAASLDLVVVASPTTKHAEHTAQVLRAGVPAVVDKPLATTEQAATELVRLATQHGGRLTVFHDRRWDPEQLTLAGLLERGELGRVHRFERRWERFRPIPLHRWKELDPAAGGLLQDLGSHLVDSAMQLFGPVTSVYAELRTLTTPALDDVFLALTHAAPADGPAVISHLQTGGLVGAPGPRTRVLGDKAAYLVTEFEEEPTPFEALDHRRGTPAHQGWLVRGSERVPVPSAPGDHLDLYRAIIRWVTDGGRPPVDPRDSIRVARVLDAARVSAKEGRAVHLT